MKIDYSKYYVDFNTAAKNDVELKMLVIKEFEEMLKGLSNTEAYNRLREMILKYKTMVNVECEFLGLDKKYQIESNPFLETICKLELDNRILKYMGKATVRELFTAKKLQEDDKDIILKGFEGNSKMYNIGNEESKPKDPLELSIKRLEKENAKLKDLIKTISKKFNIEKFKSKEQVVEREKSIK